ncbi:hypothetical protein CHUAL_003405 [Chamberlinius hualienensis]
MINLWCFFFFFLYFSDYSYVPSMSSDNAPLNVAATGSERNATADVSVACPNCLKTFVSNSTLFRHLRASCLSSEEHKCFVCKRVFSRRDGLIDHMKKQHGEIISVLKISPKRYLI